MRKTAQIALAACFIALSAVAQIIPPANIDWQNIRNSQPAELSLKLELTGTTFRQGDVIDATLTFSNSSTAAQYHLWTGNGDYSGRISDIDFYATGSDGKPVTDPLRWYFERGGMGGGLGGTADLGQWQITLPVNQWLRFDKPGVYKLFAYSNRVQKGDRFARSSQGNRVELVSDPVTITIDSLTPAQEQQILSQARTDMASGGQAAAQAVTTLRYLGTPDSLAALLPLLNSPQSSDAVFAFLAAPDPAAEAPVILAAVRDGRLELNQNLIFLYQSLKTAGFRLDPSVPRKDIEATVKKIMADRQDAASEITAAMASTGSKGPGYYQALLVILNQNPDKRAETRAALVKAQLDLTPDQVKEFIGGWNIWGGEDFLPMIRKAAGPPTYDPAALKVLAQLKPDEARPLIIEDIQRPKPRYLIPRASSSIAVAPLLSLPKAPIPELEPYFRNYLRSRLTPVVKGERLDLLTPLIDRYGTPALLPDVVKLYTPGEGSRACDIQTPLLRFWIRYDPATGAEALKRALYSRELTHCYTKVLTDVLMDEWDDAALPVVTEALADSDAEVTASAIKVLEQNTASDKLLAPSIAAIRRISTLATKDNLPALHATQDAARTLLQSTRWSLNPAQRQELQGYESLQPR